MKKSLLTVCCICLMMLVSSAHANAEDFVRPPENLKNLFGKVVTLKDSNSSATFMCHITGVSEYLSQMAKGVVVSVAGLDYYGTEVKTLSYIVTTGEERWEIQNNGKAQKITITSIE